MSSQAGCPEQHRELGERGPAKGQVSGNVADRRRNRGND
jgi:hypothetical protein